jgi:hypothetical protein
MFLVSSLRSGVFAITRNLELARIIHEITSEEQASPVAANGPVP